MDHLVNALPGAKHGDLQVCRPKTYPTHWSIPPPPPPSTLEHLLNLVKALTHVQNQNIIVLGDLNTNTQSQNPFSQKVAELMTELGLVDL